MQNASSSAPPIEDNTLSVVSRLYNEAHKTLPQLLRVLIHLGFEPEYKADTPPNPATMVKCFVMMRYLMSQYAKTSDTIVDEENAVQFYDGVIKKAATEFAEINLHCPCHNCVANRAPEEAVPPFDEDPYYTPQEEQIARATLGKLANDKDARLAVEINNLEKAKQEALDLFTKGRNKEVTFIYADDVAAGPQDEEETSMEEDEDSIDDVEKAKADFKKGLRNLITKIINSNK